MSVINKIHLPPPDIRIKGARVEKSLSAGQDNFESQFLEMVEKVETMGSEIEAMMEKTETGTAVAIKKGVNRVGHYIKSMSGLVEDFSSSDQEGNPVGVNKSNIYNRLHEKKNPELQ